MRKSINQPKQVATAPTIEPPDRASSLAHLLWGQGIENFNSCALEVQDDVLFLLSDEIEQGIAALAHEEKEQQAHSAGAQS